MARRPFSDTDTYTAFRAYLHATLDEIRELETEYVLKASPTELEQFFVSKVIIDPLVLHVDQKYIDSESRISWEQSDYGQMIKVSGTLLRIGIPYEGDKLLWNVRPSMFGSTYPEIDIGPTAITSRIGWRMAIAARRNA